MRREAPVHWYDWEWGKGFWCITRWDDIVAVLKDWRTFSSETGATALEDLDPDQIEARKSMLDTDPPEHTRLRGDRQQGLHPARRRRLRDPAPRPHPRHPRPCAPEGRVRLHRGDRQDAADPRAVRDPRRSPGGQRAPDRVGRQDDRQHRPRHGRPAPGEPRERRVPPPPLPQPGCARGLRVRPPASRPSARRHPKDDLVSKLVPGRTKTATASPSASSTRCS